MLSWLPWRNLRRRGAVRFLAPMLLAPWLCTQAWAGAVWVALSSRMPAYLETAEALRAALPESEIEVGDWTDFKPRLNRQPPQWLVAVGSDALWQLHDAAGTARILALMAPRSMVDDLRKQSSGRVTGVYFEQPFSRLARLLQATFPERTRVGAVLGPTTGRYRGELTRALQRAGLVAVIAAAQSRAVLSDALREVLAKSDVLLALPDPEVMSNQTARVILLAAYRHGIPLIGYSASFVKAGAAAALISSPKQIATEAAHLLRTAAAGNSAPEPRAAEGFTVLVNSNVSRSLGLGLDAALIEEQLRAEETRH
jgi:ABC-type uncharacterized transport system substrate-binding protein